MRIYLDNSCFNRPFDDQKQLRIKLETEAKLDIQRQISQRNLELTSLCDNVTETLPYGKKE